MSASTLETLCPVRQLTHPPGHHFFGYYEKRPWDAAGEAQRPTAGAAG